MGKKKKKVRADRKPIGVCAECGRLAYRRGTFRTGKGKARRTAPLCHMHYMRLYRNGDLRRHDRVLQPEDLRYIRKLHRQGCLPHEIRELLLTTRDVDVSIWTIYRRLKTDYEED